MMTVKASGLLSVVFRASFSALGVAVKYARAYPRRSAELSRASLTHFPLCPPPWRILAQAGVCRAEGGERDAAERARALEAVAGL